MGGTLSSVAYQKPSLPSTRCEGKRALHVSTVVVVEVAVVLVVVSMVVVVVVTGLLLPHATNGFVVDPPAVLPASFALKSAVTLEQAPVGPAASAAMSTWRTRRVPVASGTHWMGPEVVGIVALVAVVVEIEVVVVVVVVVCVIGGTHAPSTTSCPPLQIQHSPSELHPAHLATSISALQHFSPRQMPDLHSG